MGKCEYCGKNPCKCGAEEYKIEYGNFGVSVAEAAARLEAMRWSYNARSDAMAYADTNMIPPRDGNNYV